MPRLQIETSVIGSHFAEYQGAVSFHPPPSEVQAAIIMAAAPTSRLSGDWDSQKTTTLVFPDVGLEDIRQVGINIARALHLEGHMRSLNGEHPFDESTSNVISPHPGRLSLRGLVASTQQRLHNVL